jgi:membrane associated rhomboid family serine protease
MFLIYALIDIILAILLGSLIFPYPIGDASSMRYGSFPWMTVSLIVINTGIFMFWQYPDIVRFLNATTEAEMETAFWAVKMRNFVFGSSGQAIRDQFGIGAVATFSGMFMHGSVSHLVSNMLFLWVFGRRVEDACGAWRFLLFYLFAGMASKMTYYILIAGDRRSIGASGAISGLMGAYIILFPGVRIRSVWLGMTVLRGIGITLLRFFGIGWGRFAWTLSLPSFALILAFLGNDIVDTFRSAQTQRLIGYTNYVAHAGGFLSAVVILLFVRKDLVLRYFIGRRL